MVFFIGIVLALVCAWLICQFIRKFGKRFFTRFIPMFFTYFIPKFFKVMMWITLVVSVLCITGQIVCYVGNCICIRDEMTAYHFLPGDIVPQIRKHGVKKSCLRYYKKMSEEKYEAMVKKQKEEKEALVKKKSLRDHGPFPDTFWWRVPNYLFMKYGKWKYGEYFGEF